MLQVGGLVLLPRWQPTKFVTQELLDAQVESLRDEQESKGETPRGICL